MQDIAFSLTIGTLTFLFSVVWGRPLIARLSALGPVGVGVEDPPAPTLGGLLVIVPTVLITVGILATRLALGQVPGRSILLPVSVMLAFGGLGALNDWERMRGVVSRRVPPRLRYGVIAAVAVGAGVVLFALFDIRSLALPGITERIDLGWRYLLVAPLFIFGMTGAMDLTDGVDGLAGIVAVTAFSAYAIIAILQGQFFITQFCLTLVGALVALLWFNVYPAQLKLGESGALALGGSLATVALLTGQWLILPVVALIPVLEALSVVIQRVTTRLSRALGHTPPIAPFAAVPLHRHFAVRGWSQVQIFQRFWVIQLLASTVGVALALL
jgi:phospho-N-acetylmuramoyl-pentapeptide-transferase